MLARAIILSMVPLVLKTPDRNSVRVGCRIRRCGRTGDRVWAGMLDDDGGGYARYRWDGSFFDARAVREQLVTKQLIDL